MRKKQVKATKESPSQLVHIRFPKSILYQVKERAVKENRTISNAIVTMVSESLTND